MDKNTDTQALELVEAEQSAIVAPAVSVEVAVANFDAYQKLVSGLLKAEDYQKIGDKQFKKKSAWRKLATAFNLNVVVVKEERKVYDDCFVFEITARATAMNGRVMEGTGSCASNERKFAHTEHDVRATAETRAKNRAISDLIGAGEVSAEEVEADQGKAPARPSVQEQATDADVEDRAPQAPAKIEKGCPIDHDSLNVLTVKKEGRNQGKKFQACSQCDHFKWVQE